MVYHFDILLPSFCCHLDFTCMLSVVYSFLILLSKLTALYCAHCMLLLCRGVMGENFSVHYTLYSLQCNLCTVHCSVYTVQCIVYTVHCTLYNVHCTLYTVHSTLYTVIYTLYTVRCQSEEG